MPKEKSFSEKDRYDTPFIVGLAPNSIADS